MFNSRQSSRIANRKCGIICLESESLNSSCNTVLLQYSKAICTLAKKKCKPANGKKLIRVLLYNSSFTSLAMFWSFWIDTSIFPNFTVSLEFYIVLWLMVIAKMGGFENQPQRIVSINYDERDSYPCPYLPMTNIGFKFAAACHYRTGGEPLHCRTIDVSTLDIGIRKLRSQHICTTSHLLTNTTETKASYRLSE